MTAERNKTDVVIVNPQGAEELLVGSVSNLRVGYIRHNIVDAVLVDIHYHHFTAQLLHSLRDMGSKLSRADNQNRFHISFSLLYPIDIVSRGRREFLLPDEGSAA